MDQIAIIPGSGTGEFVELSARPGVQPQGKLFRKQILRWGSFVHPKNKTQKIKVDRDFAEKLILNFANGACDIVQFPAVNDHNQHVEAPDRNLGEVIDLDYDEKGINAYIDVRKNPEDIGKTILGASAMMHLDYEDSISGRKVGPTLLHVVATNRPYLTNLDPFSEVVAASADTPDEAAIWAAEDQAVELSEPGGDDMPKTKEELIAELRDEHGIDVAALLEQQEEVAQLSALGIGDDGELSVRDVAEAVIELSQTNTTLVEQVAALSAANEAMEQERATHEVDELIRAGRVLPRQRETMIRLARTDRETFDELVPDEAIVSLSEDGVTTHQSTVSDESKAEVDRLIDLAKTWKSNQK